MTCSLHFFDGERARGHALRKRVRAVADKYAHMDSVALVSHGMAMRTLRTMHDVGYAEIVELDYSPDMPDCVNWDE